MVDFFNNPDIEEGEKRNLAFQAVVGVRETLSIATKRPQPITYEQALNYVHDLNPDLYQKVNTLLTNKNESDTVKYYIEKAEALSTLDETIEPLLLIIKDIEENEELKKKAPNKTSFIDKKLIELKSAYNFFQPRKVSEHKILNHDFYLANRRGYFSKKIYENDSYKDYQLSKNKLLRMRLLHPDKAEAILGVDLIYEIYDLESNKVRFCHLQYKMWDAESNTISLDDRAFGQIRKIESNLCHNNFCKDSNGSKHSERYRLPYCCGFLRPTDRLQDSESKLVSSGVHIPVCEVRKLKANKKPLNKKNISQISISSKHFENLFNEDLIGSRWITIDELEKFYEEKDIASFTNTIRIHAQEIDVENIW